MSSSTEIIPNLWVGTAEATADNRWTCIINCTDNIPFPEGYTGAKYRIPIRDNGKQDEIDKMYAVLPGATEILYNALHHHRVLVHCYAGRHRSVTLILAFLMRYGEMTLQESIDALRSKWDNIGFNFVDALARYQLDLHGAENIM